MIWKWTHRQFNTVAWHNAYTGTPAFFCCNGPSFGAVDPALLPGPGRIVLGVNSTYPRLRPDFWIGMDLPENFDARLWWEPFPKICRGNFGDVRFHGHALKELTATYFADIGEKGNFWDWSERTMLHWNHNTFFAALQFALWLGVREFAFVGVDLSMEKGHYGDGNYLSPAAQAGNARLYEGTLAFLRGFVEQGKTLGISCCCCSPDSKLAEFMPVRGIPEVAAGWERALPSGRARLHVSDAPASPPARDAGQRNVVLVLRSGGAYQPEHVHRLVRQLPGCTVGLLTDFPREQFPGLYVIPLKHRWPGWWSKMEMFDPEIAGDFLYLDLDTSVRSLPDAFFGLPTSVGLAPFTAELCDGLPGWHQSGMMWLRGIDRAKVWEKWMADPEGHMRECAHDRAKFPGDWGDQKFINGCGLALKSWQSLFPKAVASYKANWLPGTDFQGRPLDRDSIRVVCYHGTPKPWENAEAWPESAASAALPAALPPADPACLGFHLAASPPGPRIEFGVFHAESLVLIAQHGGLTVGVDSFQGMAEPTARDAGEDGRQEYPRGRLAAPLEEARRKCPAALLVEGFVPEVLGKLPAGPYAFAHLDLDHYEPTLAALRWLFDGRLLPGAVVLCHDWFAGRTHLAAGACADFAREAAPLSGTAGSYCWWVFAHAPAAKLLSAPPPRPPDVFFPKKLTEAELRRCRNTMSSDMLAAVVMDALFCHQPLSLVRMGDGERMLLRHLHSREKSPLLTNPAWLRGAGLEGADFDLIAQALLEAGRDADWFGPNPAGMFRPGYDLSEWFDRDRLVETFYNRQWLAQGRAGEVLRAARRVFLIAEKCDEWGAGLKAVHGIETAGYPYANWRQREDAVVAAGKSGCPLVLTAAGPSGKYLPVEIARRSGRVALDVGCVLSLWSRPLPLP